MDVYKRRRSLRYRSALKNSVSLGHFLPRPERNASSLHAVCLLSVPTGGMLASLQCDCHTVTPSGELISETGNDANEPRPIHFVIHEANNCKRVSFRGPAQTRLSKI